MERRRGLVVRQDEPADIAGSAAARRRVSEAVVDALAELHAIDPRVGPVAALGKPAGFVRRQVAGWTERWDRSKTHDVPEMDALAGWLAARIPADAPRPSIVHGDYKLDNVMLDRLDAGRLVAVFDWEMCALGDPLVDLGILLAYWCPFRASASEPEAADALTTVTGQPGWFSREEILDRYEERSGRHLTAMRFYEVFARFKIAVVIQQIYQRFVNRQTDDARFAHFGTRVTALARQAAQAAED
jgi:aminoglycoside phosphotransferase (APT) family kinase protein